MDENVEQELADLHPDRRAFVKRVVAVTAFTAPMVASYDLESLSSSVAHAQTASNTTTTSNTTSTSNTTTVSNQTHRPL